MMKIEKLSNKIERIFMYCLCGGKIYLTIVYKSGKTVEIPFSKKPKSAHYFMLCHNHFEHYNEIHNRIELVYE